MIETLFSIEIFKYQCIDWEFKKQKILDLINIENFKNDDNDFVSSRNLDEKNPSQLKLNFSKIFSQELLRFSQELGVDNISVRDVWSVKYNLNDFQAPHNHLSYSYSGILYVDYDERCHQPTEFIAPWNHPIFDGTISKTIKNIKESTIVFFPSFLLHYAPQNKTDKERKVVSFDLLINPCYDGI